MWHYLGMATPERSASYGRWLFLFGFYLYSQPPCPSIININSDLWYRCSSTKKMRQNKIHQKMKRETRNASRRMQKPKRWSLRHIQNERGDRRMRQTNYLQTLPSTPHHHHSCPYTHHSCAARRSVGRCTCVHGIVLLSSKSFSYSGK